MFKVTFGDTLEFSDEQLLAGVKAAEPIIDFELQMRSFNLSAECCMRYDFTEVRKIIGANEWSTDADSVFFDFTTLIDDSSNCLKMNFNNPDDSPYEIPDLSTIEKELGLI